MRREEDSTAFAMAGDEKKETQDEDEAENKQEDEESQMKNCNY